MFKCKKCQAYQEQIAYLQKLIDNLLQNKGIAPIDSHPTVLEETDEEKEDRALLEKGAQRYGD